MEDDLIADTEDTEDDGPLQLDAETREALQILYIDEMSLPNQKTDDEWAAENGISSRTLRRWKKSAKFKELQKTRLTSTHFSPNKVGRVLENLYKAAATEKGSVAVQAAKTYMELLNRVAPMEPAEDTGLGDFRDMTLTELEEAAGVIRGS